MALKSASQLRLMSSETHPYQEHEKVLELTAANASGQRVRTGSRRDLNPGWSILQPGGNRMTPCGHSRGPGNRPHGSGVAAAVGGKDPDDPHQASSRTTNSNSATQARDSQPTGLALGRRRGRGTRPGNTACPVWGRASHPM